MKKTLISIILALLIPTLASASALFGTDIHIKDNTIFVDNYDTIDFVSENLKTTGNISLAADNATLYFGEDKDISAYFDAPSNSFTIDASANSSSVRLMGDGTENFFQVSSTNPKIFMEDLTNGVDWQFGAQGGIFQIINATESVNFLRIFYSTGTGQSIFNFGKVDIDHVFNGDTAEIARFNGGTDSLDFKDNKKINLGDAKDAGIYFDTDEDSAILDSSKTFWVTSGIATNSTSITNDYTVQDNDYWIVIDASSNTVDVTMPADPGTGKKSREIKFTGLDDTNNIMLLRNGKKFGGEDIDFAIYSDETWIFQFEPIGGSWW